ncbi:sulfotransferase [Thalassospira sp. A3_1]|uniref:tetratricopeptide repeat-containing sulfotransferase family protein n=1 Tax=Thalassospira sp. A3_1 TaxID=2821088 RepID=UPI001ADA864F|nr:sulfotransferase [Thalassospira sp. A3_1]MBO9509430.1 sulfotransferase [Thalassospira sp. A3_1]
MAQVQKDIAAEMKKAMSAGQFDKAAFIGAKLVRTHPKRTEIHIMTAVAEMQGSHFARGGQRLRHLFRSLEPGDRYFGPVAQNLLHFSDRSGDFKASIEIVEQKHRNAPKDPAYREILADLLFRQEIMRFGSGRSVSASIDRAIGLLEGIAHGYPRLPEVQRLLLRVYMHCEMTQKALGLLDKLIADAPGDKGLRIFQASVLALSGMVDRAITACIRLIDDYDDIGAQPYLHIAFLRPEAMPVGATDTLSKIAFSDDAPAREVYQACFALARMAEAENNMETAFDWYRRGHVANRQVSPIDMPLELAEMERIGELVKAEAKWEDGEGAISAVTMAETGPRPIFIVGLPRSGTTLSERILGAHPDVFAAGEIADFSKIVVDVTGTGKISEQMERLDGKMIGEIRKRYLAALNAYDPNVKFVTNKTPANFLRVGLIRRVFPDAPILHTHRHPLATCLSLYTTPFAIPMRYADDLGDLADYYRAYEKLMSVLFETDRNGTLFDLSYEDLVAEPEQVARDYLAHCGLDWRPECLEFYREEKAARTASMTQVRRPINRDAVGKWQRFSRYIGPLADLAVDDKSVGKKSQGRTVVA